MWSHLCLSPYRGAEAESLLYEEERYPETKLYPASQTCSFSRLFNQVTHWDRILKQMRILHKLFQQGVTQTGSPGEAGLWVVVCFFC